MKKKTNQSTWEMKTKGEKKGFQSYLLQYDTILYDGDLKKRNFKKTNTKI